MEQVVLVRYGEIILKGLNRRSFEERLAGNIRRAAAPLGRAHIEIAQGRIFIEPREMNYDLAAASMKARNVFGVVSTSVAYKTGKSREAIATAAETAAREYINTHSPTAPGGKYTFKVETKRSDKTYGRISPVISRDLGDDLLFDTHTSQGAMGDDLLSDAHTSQGAMGDDLLFDTHTSQGAMGDGQPPLSSVLSVDINNPQFIIYVEVRESSAYVYTEKEEGFGGLPVGSNGKALLLLSGGIDSPVAGFMMAKRGVGLEAIHFYSYPYTNERSKEKVIKLGEILAEYMGKFTINIVPFTDVQLSIRDNCHAEYLTIVMRRIMIYIAETIAKQTSSQALVTGESMGQVASQTIQSLAVTDCATALPIFRPLIGMDKSEVINIARRIGTFETSILPYEDCCTLFTPKHPKTKPKLCDVLEQEAKIAGLAELIQKAAEATERIAVGGGF